MRANRVCGVVARCLAWAALIACEVAAAQTPASAPLAPRPVVPVENAGCNSVEKPLSAGGASIVPEAVGQQKAWQPRGGEITFTVRSFVPIPADSQVLVCFRWKRLTERPDDFISTRPTHLDLGDGGRTLRVTVVVPMHLRNPPSRFSGDGEFAAFHLVPLADVRILVLAKDASGNFAVAADVSHAIGVTHPAYAFALALFTVLAVFGVLTVISHRRLKRVGIDGLDPVLRIITTADGYASLSHFQMILWTFVVAASAVYVMVLSGELIQITTGTLVLLGISGAVAVATKVHDQSQAPAEEAAAAPLPPRKPRWSDLMVSEVNGRREIDITRVQMLYFTMITATFVVMRVAATYVIPEIPEGFQLLMGLSNAVYMGSKVASPVANTAAASPPGPPPPA